MKLSDVYGKLYKRGTTKFPYMEHYKYDYYREPKLKNKISGAVCLEEMMAMFLCLKNSEFDQKPCTKFIDIFKTCVKTTEDARYQAKQARIKGTAIPVSDDSTSSGKKLPTVVINRLLRQFPEPE